MKSTRITTKHTALLLSQAKTIALIAHTRPDGDTLGASVALSLALKKLGKTVKIFCDSAIESSYAQFGNFDDICSVFEGAYDIMVAVDCGDLARLGMFCAEFSHHKNTLSIDHHDGEDYADNNCHYLYASTCQIVYEIISYMDCAIDLDIATCLYIGLCADTGNFAHNNTDKACFEMASKLIDYDVPIGTISRVFFKDIPLTKAKLVGRALSRLRLYYDNRLAVLYADFEDYRQLGVDIDATNYLVQYATNIDCVEVGISIAQYKDNVYKVSMRSKHIDVKSICKDFGGGGHKYASGCMLSGFFEDVVDKLVRAVGFAL